MLRGTCRLLRIERNHFHKPARPTPPVPSPPKEMQYTSQQHTVHHPAEVVYKSLSSFSNFTPILAHKVEGWQADEDRCSFKAQGFDVALQIAERKENELIKVIPASEGALPFEFAFFLQLKQVAPNETHLGVVLEAHMNMMVKMMVGSKLQDAVDKIAEQIAQSFNKI